MRKVPTITICLAAALAGAALSGCSNITASEAAKNRYAIVIGIAQYDTYYAEGANGSPNLTYPDEDAKDMAKLLDSKGWNVVSYLANGDAGAYTNSNGETVSPISATRDNIYNAISGLSTYIGSNTNATVLVYYSGHGDLNTNGEACIIPKDACSDTASVSFNESLYISAAKVSEWLGALSCKNKILILDSCYSGGFVDTGSSTDAIPSSYGILEGGTEASLLEAALGNFGTLLQNSIAANGDPDVLTITAAGSKEYSYDDSGHAHGAFTYYLLQAASSADSDGDGYVTATEAYAYAKKKIKSVWDANYTNNLSYWQWYLNLDSTNQVPDFMPHISGGTGDLVLYVNN